MDQSYDLWLRGWSIELKTLARELIMAYKGFTKGQAKDKRDHRLGI
jgi:hypothetical protein